MFSKFKISIYFVLILLFNLGFSLDKPDHIIVDTVYGTEMISDPVIIDLINNYYFQRLKRVNQYGVDFYIYKPEEYTRYDHSLGVFLLSRKYGASLKEQVASLLHDVSHTAFSHVADFLFNKADSKDSYQDDIHYEFIKNTSLKEVLKKHGFKIKDIVHKSKSFRRLEADIPDICADRLEYNLYGGLLEGLINKNDINSILENLKFEDGQWFFINSYYARKFADITIYLTKYRWGSHDNAVRNTLFANVLKTAVEIKLIDFKDISYGFDDEIWSKLLLCDDPFIKKGIDKLVNFKNSFVVNRENFDLFLKPKCRAVDPLVKIGNKLIRLSSIDQEFKTRLDYLKDLLSQGLCIKFI
ncbi:HD domain-containing protein [Candidatus Babela massiliensis]|uniref:HD superfamily phosphohydrolase n=1 Tax=Candidatus Babela massiliensis TaxID=673862 RepID=V6DGI1_9BACT|nr:HD domain-containing protein [Candidatus Babela massiliensis]CDK30675.1 HD superfamily phosphohydrolase [Candidatus Babela massiliensis]